MPQLGANAFGEALESGRVPDCYLGLRLNPADDNAKAAGVLVVAFVADLTVEVRAWPADTWAKLAVDPQAVVGAIIAAWRRSDLAGLRLGELTDREALARERPAMTYVSSSASGSATRSARRIGGGCIPQAEAGRQHPKSKEVT